MHETQTHYSLNSNFSKVFKAFERFSGYFIIFGLAGGAITNVLLYYLGLHHTVLRPKLFIAITIFVFCIAILRFLQIYITTPDTRRRLLLGLIYPVCGLLIFLGAHIVFKEKALQALDSLVQFGVFCIPAFIFGVDCALNQREQVLFKTLRTMTVFYMPFALLGVFTLFSSSNNTGKIAMIGELHYMNVAYTLLLPLPFLVIGLSLLPERRPLKPCLNKSPIRNLKWIICLGIILLFWFVILATGTRGAIMCVLGLIVFLLIWAIYVKNKKVLLRSGAIFLIILIVFSVFMFGVKSDYTKGAASGFNLFMSGIMQGEIQTSNTKAISVEELDLIINNSSDIDTTEIVMNREQLFYAAWGEFKNNPLIGIGPLGFMIKYNRYAHNVILEVLCDYGLIGGFLIFGIIIKYLIRLISLSKQDTTCNFMLVLLIVMNSSLLMSSTFTAHPAAWFFLGYAANIAKNSVPKTLGVEV